MELKIKNTNWISIIKPARNDIEELSKRFPQIHPIVLEDLLTPTMRSRVESYDHHLYMVLHFPNFQAKTKKTIANEVDFVLTQDTLITIQYDEINILENFKKAIEKDTDIQDQYGKTPIHLVYYLLIQFFAFALKELDEIQGQIDDMEEHVFSGKEKEILEDISLLKRNVLDFRRAIKPQQLTFESLSLQAVQLYGEKVRPFLNDLSGEYLKVWNLLENHKETLDALYDTNSSLLATKTNEIMRVFTILAFISFIPTAIANIYGMNISNIPLTDSPDAFWVILVFMVIFTIGVYILLKWRKLV